MRAEPAFWGPEVEKVDFQANKVVVEVKTPSGTPPVQDLVQSLDGQIPTGVPVVVITSVGVIKRTT